MKKILSLIIIGINIIGIIIGCGVEARTTTIEKDRLEEIKEKGLLTVAAPPKEIPFAFINPETKEIEGIDADIIIEIARRLGINKIEVKEAPFSDLLEEFTTDNSTDISIGGIFITPESEELVNFTKPIYKESEAVIVSKLSQINYISDLKNSAIGVEAGTIFENLAKKWKEDNLVKDVLVFSSTADIFNALNTKKIDAALADSIIINYHLIKEKNPTIRVLKGYTPQLQGVMGIGVKKSDVSLLNELNKVISEMEADGTLYSILVKNGLDKSNMIEK